MGVSRDLFADVDAIYCINLKRRSDRWGLAKKEFEKLDIMPRVRRFEAIEAADPADGCRLSHMAVVRRAREEAARSILVFEDDVQFIGLNLEPLHMALKTLSTVDGWEMFYFGGRIVSPITIVTENLIKARFWSAHAYIVHQRAYRKVERATGAIDVWYSRHMRSYGVRPMVATQRAGYSDIEGRENGCKTHAFMNSLATQKKRIYRNRLTAWFYDLYDRLFATTRVRKGSARRRRRP